MEHSNTYRAEKMIADYRCQNVDSRYRHQNGLDTERIRCHVFPFWVVYVVLTQGEALGELKLPGVEGYSAIRSEQAAFDRVFIRGTSQLRLFGTNEAYAILPDVVYAMEWPVLTVRSCSMIKEVAMALIIPMESVDKKRRKPQLALLIRS